MAFAHRHTASRPRRWSAGPRRSAAGPGGPARRAPAGATPARRTGSACRAVRRNITSQRATVWATSTVVVLHRGRETSIPAVARRRPRVPVTASRSGRPSTWTAVLASRLARAQCGRGPPPSSNRSGKERRCSADDAPAAAAPAMEATRRSSVAATRAPPATINVSTRVEVSSGSATSCSPLSVRTGPGRRRATPVVCVAAPCGPAERRRWPRRRPRAGRSRRGLDAVVDDDHRRCRRDMRRSCAGGERIGR